MQGVYFALAAVHLVAIAVTGILWTIVDVVPKTGLRAHLWDIRAVHFGSLYLVPMFLGLAWAFQYLHVPPEQQLVFPVGLGLLVFFAGIAYLFPLPKDLQPARYWTRGWPLVLSLIGMACLALSLVWTAVVLVRYAFPRG